MISYQSLCQQYQQFQRKQKGQEKLLSVEIESLKQQLAKSLGLAEKYYRKNITDDEATEPYVTVSKIQIISDHINTPEIIFTLAVALEESPESYPKHILEQTLRCGFIQSDRLYFTFIKARPELKFTVNLLDDEPIKYRPIVEAYTQLLMKQLSR